MLRRFDNMTDPITIRPAAMDDGELLWNWRNDPAVRRASLTSDKIPLADHLKWYESAVNDPNRQILIADYHGAPAGMVRFDRHDNVATVNILLDPEFRGRSLAKLILAAAIKSFGKKAKRLRAVVKPDNPASLALFRSLSFCEVSRGDTINLEMVLSHDG